MIAVLFADPVVAGCIGAAVISLTIVTVVLVRIVTDKTEQTDDGTISRGAAIIG